MTDGRYQVRIIGSGALADVLLTTDDVAAAKARADELGGQYYYGVAILDTQTGMVDCGDRVVPIAEAFRDGEA